MKCAICHSNKEKVFDALVLGKHKVGYYECQNCGLIQPESFHWLDEAYASPINLEDTGILARNLHFADRVGAILLSLFGKEGKFLDYAGGYGIFTRLMRDRGFDYYWDDPYTSNLVARGFEAPEGAKFSALTAFETFEHLTNPVEELEKMLQFSDTIIFSTELASRPTPMLEDWWYYAPHHGQHVAFYRRESLQLLAEKFGMNFYTNGFNLHVITGKKSYPKIVESKWLKLFPGGNYNQIDVSVPGRIRGRIQTLKRRLLAGTYYQLEDEGTEISEDSGYTTYLEQLLNEDVTKWKRFMSYYLESKTFTDMLDMKKLREKQQKL